jgi:hypothetical protein
MKHLLTLLVALALAPFAQANVNMWYTVDSGGYFNEVYRDANNNYFRTQIGALGNGFGSTQSAGCLRFFGGGVIMINADGSHIYDVNTSTGATTAWTSATGLATAESNAGYTPPGPHSLVTTASTVLYVVDGGNGFVGSITTSGSSKGAVTWNTSRTFNIASPVNYPCYDYGQPSSTSHGTTLWGVSSWNRANDDLYYVSGWGSNPNTQTLEYTQNNNGCFAVTFGGSNSGTGRLYYVDGSNGTDIYYYTDNGTGATFLVTAPTGGYQIYGIVGQ